METEWSGGRRTGTEKCGRNVGVIGSAEGGGGKGGGSEGEVGNEGGVGIEVLLGAGVGRKGGLRVRYMME